MNLFFYVVNNNNMKILLLLFLFIPKIYAEEKINYLENITIENYEINFDKNIYEYEIVINEEKELNIDYELSNQDIYVCVTGNGNFNSSDNIITINVNNEFYYTIHAYKTINVSLIEEIEEIKEISPLKKEIVKLVIITISSCLVFSFYYITFINKKKINI